MLRLARSFNREPNFEAMAGKRIPHSDGAFDLVCSIAVIHHNSYQRQDEILTEISRVVHKGGFAILFEGLGPRTTRGIFFPRPAADWISALEERGLRLRHHRRYRYSLMGSLVLALRRRLPGRRSPEAGPGTPKPAWQRLADRVDETLAPRFAPMLPTRTQNRGLFVLQRVT